MTDLLSRPTTRRPAPGGGHRPSAVVAAALAAGGAALFGLVPLVLLSLLTWTTAARAGASAGEAMRTAAQLWLLAQHTGLGLPHGSLGLVPLGLTLLPALLLWRAGGQLARAVAPAGLPEAAGATGALALAYALLAVAVAGAAGTGSVHPALLQAFLGPLVLAVGCAGAGLVRACGLTGRLLEPVPARARAVLAGGLAGAGTLLAGGALLLAASLAFHLPRGAALARDLDPGVVGGLALFLLGLALLPVGAVWGAAYAVGPGFAVGAGTSVSPAAIHLGAVPSVPVLAALPATGSAPLAALPVLLAPIVAGLLAGHLAIRRLPALTLETAAGWGFAAGAGSGVLLGLAALLAGGPAGPGRMATVGPSAWQVALAAALEVGLVAAAAAAETQRRLMRS